MAVAGNTAVAVTVIIGIATAIAVAITVAVAVAIAVTTAVAIVVAVTVTTTIAIPTAVAIVVAVAVTVAGGYWAKAIVIRTRANQLRFSSHGLNTDGSRVVKHLHINRTFSSSCSQHLKTRTQNEYR